MHNDDETRLKIGAVSRLTGLSVHTVRKWEERYGAVTPIRTERGQRLYSRDDVRRLALIRQLTQAGLPLNDIAGAPISRLERTADSMAPAREDGFANGMQVKSVRAVVVGDALPTQLAVSSAVTPALRIVASGDSAAAAAAELGERSADMLLCELPTVQPSSLAEVQSAAATCRVRATVVIYGFGSSAALSELRQPNIALMRAPVDLGNLQRTALGLMLELGASVSPGDAAEGAPQDPEVPEPRFSRKVIAKVVTQSPAMQCECPHHIAGLLFSLRAFEDYSAQCETANPDDATLHRYLKITAGVSRAAFEEALARVAEAEGMKLQV